MINGLQFASDKGEKLAAFSAVWQVETAKYKCFLAFWHGLDIQL